MMLEALCRSSVVVVSAWGGLAVLLMKALLILGF